MNTRHQEKNVALDIPTELARLNSPHIADVQRYIMQTFHSNETLLDQLRWVALGQYTDNPDPATLCLLCLVTYNSNEIDSHHLDIAIDYAAQHRLEDILQSLLAMRDILDAHYTKSPSFNLHNIHFVNLGAMSLYDLKSVNLSVPHAFMNFAYLEGNHFDHVNFHGASMKHCQLSRTQFNWGNLTRALLENANLTDASFTGTDLSDAQLSFTSCERTNFNGTILVRTTFDHAQINHAIFSSVNVCHSRFEHTQINNTRFNDMTFEQTSFKHAKLNKCNLAFTRMSDVDFFSAELSECTFDFASLDQINFTKSTLTGINFFGAILTNADFTDATLSNTNFYGALFKTACFNGANLSHAIFIPADIFQQNQDAITAALTDLHQQMKDHPNRREIREAILRNIANFTRTMSLEERTTLHKAIEHHPCFGHHHPSIRKNINGSAQFFSRIRHHENDASPSSPFKSKTQKRLAKYLIPEITTESQSRRRSKHAR